MKIRNSLLLFLTAFIWGTAFVAQSTGGDLLGPFTFNGIRNFIAVLALFPVIRLLDRLGFSSKKPETEKEKKTLLKAGLCCGAALFTASSLQQLGLFMGVTTGKAGFLTACYILIVPILGIFLGKKCGLNIWIGVMFSLVGLYLLCITNGFSLQARDLTVLSCALVFSVQIMLIDHFSPFVDGVRLSQLQFLTVGILSIPFIIIREIGFSADSLSLWLGKFTDHNALFSLFYAGILSSGVAYTLQIVGQEGLNPSIASMIMSFESVFSALAGWLILGQVLSIRERIGCLLMFIAIILAQLNLNGKKTQPQNP